MLFFCFHGLHNKHGNKNNQDTRNNLNAWPQTTEDEINDQNEPGVQIGVCHGSCRPNKKNAVLREEEGDNGGKNRQL